MNAPVMARKRREKKVCTHNTPLLEREGERERGEKERERGREGERERERDRERGRERERETGREGVRKDRESE